MYLDSRYLYTQLYIAQNGSCTFQLQREEAVGSICAVSRSLSQKNEYLHLKKPTKLERQIGSLKK